jgi:NDP-sugar pyrophosphorylase family protein
VIGSQQKTTTSIGGRPFLTRLFDHLLRYSFRQAVLLTGYQAEEVQELLGHSYGELDLVYSVEPAPLGTGGAVLWALPKLCGETVLLLNGDTFCEIDLAELWVYHRHRQAEASVVVSYVEDVSEYGRVEMTEDERVRRFQEKGEIGGPGYVNAGVYLIERRLFEMAASSGFLSLERDLLPEWVERGRMFGFPHDGSFLDIGTEDTYAVAKQRFAVT